MNEISRLWTLLKQRETKYKNEIEVLGHKDNPEWHLNQNMLKTVVACLLQEENNKVKTPKYVQ